MNHHLSLKEKTKLLITTTVLSDDEALELAKILDCCPYAELRRIAEAISIMSIGHDK